MGLLHENIQPKNCLEDAKFLQVFRVVSSDGGPWQWMLWLTSQRAKWMSDVWKSWWCFLVCWSFATWNQVCQICCMLHVCIHVKLVVISKSCQWSIPWLLPGLSCWTHKGVFCISLYFMLACVWYLCRVDGSSAHCCLAPQRHVLHVVN